EGFEGAKALESWPACKVQSADAYWGHPTEVPKMKTNMLFGRIMAPLVAWMTGLAACAGAATPAPEVPSAASNASAPASASGGSAPAPCAPTDCPPCDETKGKCMGPMVCDHHPEKASFVCARDTDGQCKSKLVCAP